MNNRFLINAPDYLLVAQVKAGNEKAFTVLYERYFNKLLYSIMKKFSSLRYEIIEDAVLETFLVLNENILSDKYKHDDILFSYIYTIAFYKLANNKNKNDYDDLENIIVEIFEDETEKELYFDIIEKILKDLSIGKKEKGIKCKILFDAQYTNLFIVDDRETKISDEDLYQMYPKVFTNVDNVRKRRNKCLEKLRDEFFKKKEGKNE